MMKMSKICLMIFLCALGVHSQLLYPAANTDEQRVTIQDVRRVLESQKKYSDLALSGQAKITNILWTTTCNLQYKGELAVPDEDVYRAFKTTLDLCKSACMQSTQCRAMCYENGFCFITHKYGKRSPYSGSMFYEKVCSGIYDDVKELLGQVSQLFHTVNTISSEVKSLREGLAKANLTVN